MEVSDAGLDELVVQLTLEEKVELLTGQDVWSLRPLLQIGLRSIVMSDGPAGVRGPRWDEREPSCNFPSPTAVAASWDPEVARSVGHGIGGEARRKGVDVVLAPAVNLQRTPFSGRHFEVFSEDPWLTSVIATGFVRGVQAHGVAACAKHYVANDSETNRFTVDVRVDDRTLREVYLRAFEGPVVDGGVWTVMSAYNAVNGVTATENALLTTPLQDDWGFDGVVVSDWTAVRSTESARHPQDLAMPGPDGAWGQELVRAVRAGAVPEAGIDRKVRRVLRLAARVGALDGVPAERSAAATSVVEVTRIARRAASEGMVLLRNDGDLLPLSEPARIAVIGEAAHEPRTQGGGSATVVPAAVVPALEGLRRRWPTAEITYAHGAVARTGLAPLAAGTFSTPEGDPGLLVRYLGPDGSELAREVRQHSWLVWFEADSLASRAATVELELELDLAGAAGGATAVRRLGVAGHADVEVLADGERVATLALRTGPDDDPATAVLNPPAEVVEIPTRGARTRLLVRFRPAPGGIPGGVALRVGLPPTDTPSVVLLDEAVEVARGADVAVVVVGTTNEVESEGYDRATLALPGAQDALVSAVAAVNPRTVVVVNSGAPVLLPWREEVAAILAVWFPGQEFGHALADVLSGDREPGGRLPVTWPAQEESIPVRQVVPVEGALDYAEGIHLGHRAWERADLVPAYPFGHGLGYTTFDLADIQVVEATAAFHVGVTVANTGAREGKCVVQVYARRRSPSAVDRPARWLVGSARTAVGPGVTARLEVLVDRDALAHWSDGRWSVEPGEYELLVARSAADVAAADVVRVVVPDLAPDVPGHKIETIH